jgi:D-alanyl-D-alanine carboxypeptidase
VTSDRGATVTGSSPRSERQPGRRRALGVAWVTAVLVAWALTPAAATEPAPPPVQAEAGLLIDLATGQVLFAKNAGEDRAPASLVKLMTLYLAHEDLAAGKVGLDDPVAVSQNAARTPRFRMGLVAGDVVPFRTVLLAVAVASANDAATVVAEHLSGTEEAFVSRMNTTGQEMGLGQTIFANPHGLPDPRQRSTARDMATLVGRLITDFPESRDLLGETEFSWGGRVFRRQISLFRDPGGVTALKTGYTLEARYNLAVTAAKAGHRLLCVILGAETRARSFLEAARLLRFGFGEPDGPTRPVPRRVRVKTSAPRVTPR